MKKMVCIIIVMTLSLMVGAGYVLANDDSDTSQIFVIKDTDGTDGGVNRLIQEMARHGSYFYDTDNREGLIARDDVIILKINGQWNQRGGTNTDLIKSVIQAIVDHPDGFVGEVIVADNGQQQYGGKGDGGSLDWEQNNAKDKNQSVQDVIDDFDGNYQVSGYLWDKITTTRVEEYDKGDKEDGYILKETPDKETELKVSYPKFKSEYGTYISFKKGIWDEEAQKYDKDKLKVINMPVLKAHRGYGATGCVKNYMGTTSDKLTKGNAHNSVGTGGMGTQLVETFMPTLNILDAIWVNPGPDRGPRTPYNIAEQRNTIMASTDPVALDYWAVKNVLVPEDIDFESYSYYFMNPDGDALLTFGYWLRLSMEEIRRAGYFSTVDTEKMEIYIK